ncbi:MAG: CpaF family protein [Chloroflexi bacterium]|nr:CpaF family protein [Chloroflexota bacterium]
MAENMLRVTPPVLRDAEVLKLKTQIINLVAPGLQKVATADLTRQNVRAWLEKTLDDLYPSGKIPTTVRQQVVDAAAADMVGYGPLELLLVDPQINEVMVNGPGLVFVERNGELYQTDVEFDNTAHLMHIIDRILLPLGRRVDADTPTADARLPDGSRVNVVVPPVAVDGPVVTIRKFPQSRMTIEDLIRLGTITHYMAKFLEACVVARLNILISGNTSSGKSTILNILSTFIPNLERIVTIEDAVELQLKQRHVVRLETKLPNVDGSGAVNIRDLVRNSLRMRPDRLIVGEVRGGEALDMLQAMNTGHSGSLTTLHANSPRDAIARLETMSLMAGVDLPITAVRKQISSAINLIVHMNRLPDGSRKAMQITEVAGMEGDIVTQQDIYKFYPNNTGIDGKVAGDLKPTGLRPMFTPRLEQAGFKLGGEYFGLGL